MHVRGAHTHTHSRGIDTLPPFISAQTGPHPLFWHYVCVQSSICLCIHPPVLVGVDL